MRIAAVLIGAALASVAHQAEAQQGLPSEAMLAEMGLSGIQIVSDEEASTIRGSGYSWGGGAYRYRQGIYKFHKWVYKFHRWVRDFHRHTKRLHHRVVKKHHGLHGFHGHHSKMARTPKHRPTKRW